MTKQQSTIAKTTEASVSEGADPHGLRHISTALQAFKENFAVGSFLIVVIGYIVISSFWEMHFLEYLIFLGIIYILYGVRSSKIFFYFCVVSLFIWCIWYILLFHLNISEDTYATQIIKWAKERNPQVKTVIQPEQILLEIKN